MHQVEIAHNRPRPTETAWIGHAMRDPLIDFAKVARGFGAWAEGPVKTPDQLTDILGQAVVEVEKGKVAIVDVTTTLGRAS